MAKATDARVKDLQAYVLPLEQRMPLKFGGRVTSKMGTVRVRMTLEDQAGKRAEGWGETPLATQWSWPSSVPDTERYAAMQAFCARLAKAWRGFGDSGHPLEVGWDFVDGVLPKELEAFNAARGGEPMPWLCALVCCSAFDQALHDTYGVLHDVPIYETYNAKWISRDLAGFLQPASSHVSFSGRFPNEYLTPRQARLPAWHLVGALDPIDESELKGTEPRDGLPVLLADWIRADGLKCLKIKLNGADAEWDYARIVKVGTLAVALGVDWLTTDFNCTVTDPEYVNAILDRLLKEQPRLYGMLLYVEQPFPYDLERHRIDTHSVAARKPLFLDESAHDWKHVRTGRELGWTGVALKTCKTQSGALLSLCWARAHGMTLMVQDLTNPRLAQLAHLQLAAHAGTIMGVETNSMQFWPAASAEEAQVHPGAYRRREGVMDLATLRGPGFGYRVAEIRRELPEPLA
ncbi:MAG: mandelate racemase/muconate lactonizing enzyme family protein [Planctomycetota bacterium]|nr:mandelate racemase/muconate lactonizing enzyme family protein [Planctomycetota bacterium]